MRTPRRLGPHEVLRPAAFAVADAPAPELGERSYGHVECAVRLLADLLCAGQDGQQIVTQRHRLRRGGRVAEPTEFAVAGIVAETRVEGCDSREGRVQGPVCELLVGSVQYDHELRAHVKFCTLEAYELTRVAGG